MAKRKFTAAQRASYKAGFKAGYDKALLDLHRELYPIGRQ